MRIIEQTVRYDIVQWEYRNMPITFRYWKDGSQIVEIKADKYIARANGYNSIDDMVASTIGDINGIFGGVPGWVRVDPNGHFYFIEISKSILN